MSVSRILVAVSSPWASDKLFHAVRDLADRLNASVVVAHVARATEGDQTDEEPGERGRQALNTLTTRLTDANIPAEGLLLYGTNVSKAILNAAEDQSATLILLGLSGRGAMARLLGGDVPLQVAKSARVPIMMFPPDWSRTV